MYDSQLSHIITKAITRLQAEVIQAAPFMGQQISQWIQQLSGTAQPEDYFKHPLAFPSLLLPWWAEKSLAKTPDTTLQADLVYSTINGYYYIRLIDNLMDGHVTEELAFLPALNFFHTQFQATYLPYFASGHPFWDFFKTIWFHSAETTIKDAQLVDIDEIQFKQIVAQKTCAAKIPIAAVFYRYERPDQIETWSEFVDLFGRWHQMLNDLFGWHKDQTHRTRTYFLSEAERRRNVADPLVIWVATEGFAWALDKLQTWMSELTVLANQFGNPDLVTYLNTRQAMLLNQQEDVAAGLQSLARIVASGQA
jgi:hypothetical protein